MNGFSYRADKFVKQTELGNTGNCFSACLASLFGVPLDTVPNFAKLGEANWGKNINAWLKDKGYGMIFVSTNPENLASYPGILIVAGYTQRSKDVLHAVLWHDGKLLFDPHPDNSGILEPLTMDILYPLDPMRVASIAVTEHKRVSWKGNWLPFTGDNCPVGNDEEVVVKFKDYTSPALGWADEFLWDSLKAMIPITHYKVTGAKRTPRALIYEAHNGTI